MIAIDSSMIVGLCRESVWPVGMGLIEDGNGQITRSYAPICLALPLSWCSASLGSSPWDDSRCPSSPLAAALAWLGHAIACRDVSMANGKTAMDVSRAAANLRRLPAHLLEGFCMDLWTSLFLYSPSHSRI
jgi:hypothetical protein